MYIIIKENERIPSAQLLNEYYEKRDSCKLLNREYIKSEETGKLEKIKDIRCYSEESTHQNALSGDALSGDSDTLNFKPEPKKYEWKYYKKKS